MANMFYLLHKIAKARREGSKCWLEADEFADLIAAGARVFRHGPDPSGSWIAELEFEGVFFIRAAREPLLPVPNLVNVVSQYKH